MDERTMKEHMEDENDNALVSEVINKMLKNDDILEGVLRAVPRDYECRCMKHGCDPTKQDIAFAWIWDMLED